MLPLLFALNSLNAPALFSHGLLHEQRVELLAKRVVVDFADFEAKFLNLDLLQVLVLRHVFKFPNLALPLVEG